MGDVTKEEGEGGWEIKNINLFEFSQNSPARPSEKNSIN
jgi:hypothetical protein